mmetsp:Transcript_7261/g.17591  ORF Transcript_7261/g.17591 Transcript_7261/m.17591 type:complete len:86 (-) Transcript_7261:114-371(-)
MAGRSLYERFVDPGTDPLWVRILMLALVLSCVAFYLYDCFLSGSLCPQRHAKNFVRPPRVVRMAEFAAGKKRKNKFADDERSKKD